jgi:hypothetical protein
MHYTSSTTFIIILLFTVQFIQGNPMAHSSASNNIKDRIKHLLNINGIENEYARFLSYLKIHPPKDNIRLNALYE